MHKAGFMDDNYRTEKWVIFWAVLFLHSPRFFRWEMAAAKPVP